MDDLVIESVIEDTMEDQMPRIKMIMAMSLSKRVGYLVDMKLKETHCDTCVVQSEPHTHIIGTIR